MHGVKLFVINSGFIVVPADFFIAHGGSRSIRAPVPCYLVDHPRGKLLFDTGMTMRFQERVASSPSAAAGFALELTEEQQVGARLQAMGIDPATIDLVAISHLHLDHCAGLSELPNATLLVQRPEYEVAFGDADPQYDRSYYDLGHPIKKINGEYDVFGDGTVVLFPTYGHSAGHQSLRVRLPDRDVVLASDCCYIKDVLDDFNKLGLKSSVDRDQHLRSLQLLKDLQSGGARIVCGHDPADLILSEQSPSLLI